MIGKFENQFIIILLLITLLFTSCVKEKVRDNATPTSPPIILPPTSGQNLLTATLKTVGTLSQARSDLAVAASGNKILYAGGLSSSGMYSSRVDIVDIKTNKLSSAELSQARSGIATAVLDKKIYFAGGKTESGAYSSRVDIYNSETNLWSSVNLNGIEELMVGAAAGNKVVFASGITAHIYDASTNVWTTAKLSSRPGEGNCCQGSVGGISATAIGNTIYFAGGLGWEVHDAIDMYNTSTNTWSKSSLSQYKGAAAGISVGNTNYWAGGITLSGIGYALSSQVEIRDMNLGTVKFGNLFQANSHFTAVQKNDTLVFFTGAGPEKNKFDIYALTSNKWYIGLLPQTIEGAAIISVNNINYVAGGKVNGNLSNNLSILEF